MWRKDNFRVKFGCCNLGFPYIFEICRHQTLLKCIWFALAPPVPILNLVNTCREGGRKQQGQKIGKVNSSEVMDTKQWMNLNFGHSNWTVCSMFNLFCYKKKYIFTQPPRGEKKEGSSRGRKWEKWTHQKWSAPRGFWTCGIQKSNLTISLNCIC